VPSADPSLTAARPAWGPPRWAAPVTGLLAVAGLAVAGYLTDAHYNTSTQLACPETGTVNCAKVTSSEQSAILGVPVALLGLLFFVGMLVLCLPPLWRRPEPLVRRLRLAAAGTGVLMVLWLIFAELFLVDAICLWCSAVHGIALALAVAVALATLTGTAQAELTDEELTDDELEDGDLEDDLDAAQHGPPRVPSGGHHTA